MSGLGQTCFYRNWVILSDSLTFFQDGSYAFVCLIKSCDQWENVVCISVGFIFMEKFILCKAGIFLNSLLMSLISYTLLERFSLNIDNCLFKGLLSVIIHR